MQYIDPSILSVLAIALALGVTNVVMALREQRERRKVSDLLAARRREQVRRDIW